MKKEYKIEAYNRDIFDIWLDDNLYQLKENGHMHNIIAVYNVNNKNFTNIFGNDVSTSIVLSDYANEEENKKLDRLGTELEYDLSNIEDGFTNVKEYVEFTTFFDTIEEENEARQIADDIFERMGFIFLSVTGYSQSEWDNYYIVTKDPDKTTYEDLRFIKDSFTIIETEVQLLERQIIEKDGTEFYSEWELLDSTNTWEEFPNLEKMAKKLTDANSIKEKLEVPERPEYIG